MLTKILLFIVSKTNLVRNLVLSLVGALVGAGVLARDDGAEVAAGLIILATSLLSWWVEHAKTVHVKDLQAELRTEGEPLKVDGYLGPITKRAIHKRTRGGL
jgi:hypothetical protein